MLNSINSNDAALCYQSKHWFIFIQAFTKYRLIYTMCTKTKMRKCLFTGYIQYQAWEWLFMKKTENGINSPKWAENKEKWLNVGGKKTEFSFKTENSHACNTQVVLLLIQNPVEFWVGKSKWHTLCLPYKRSLHYLK